MRGQLFEGRRSEGVYVGRVLEGEIFMKRERERELLSIHLRKILFFESATTYLVLDVVDDLKFNGSL